VSNFLAGTLDTTGSGSPTAARPRTWCGLALSVITLLALSFASFLILVALAFVAEIPIEGWSVMSGRVAWCYRIIQSGGADLLLPQRLLIGSLSPVTPRVTYGYLLVGMLRELAGIAAVFSLAWLAGGGRWRHVIAWHPWKLSGNALVFVLLLIAALAFNLGLGLIASYFVPEEPQTLASLDLSYVLLNAVESIFLSACMEELVMRGWLYTGVRAKLPAWPTIIITALLFAAGHLTTSLGNILATVPLGLAAGYLRERTGSVRAPMAFHMLHNAVAVTVLLMKA
jgi:uncharacterized protein